MKAKHLTISTRGHTAPASPIRDLIPYAEQAKAKGIKVYHLNIGDPDFPLPDEIKQPLQELARTIDWLPYPAFRGQKNLLEAWKAYYKTIGIPYDFADVDMIATAGASDGMVLIAATITDPGDEILVFEPFYAPYLTYAGFISINLVPITLSPENGYHILSKEQIVKKITPRTKAIFFTNPNNPTGTVFSREEMQMVLEVAHEYNLFVVCDETYRGIAFGNKESLSMLHIATNENIQNIIVCDSLSKKLNVCGARMGLVISKNTEMMQAAFRFTQGRPYPAYIEEEIVAPMLADFQKYLMWLTNEYKKRRDRFIKSLETHLNIKIHQPEGAFYAMVPLPIDDASRFAKWLLTDFQHHHETVMISPGYGFYATPGKGINEVRIAYVLKEKDLERAAELLALGVREYSKSLHFQKL